MISQRFSADSLVEVVLLRDIKKEKADKRVAVLIIIINFFFFFT